MKIITSIDNSLIKKFRSLSVKKYREQFGLCLLEGEKVVKEALNIPNLVEWLIIPEDSRHEYENIISKYGDILILVSNEVYKSLTFAITPQTIIAVIKIKQEGPIDPKTNLIILDHLQDPGNLGTIIRSGVASGHLNFILIDCVDPYNDKTIRSASGTIFYPNFIKMKHTQFIEFAKQNSLNLVVADMDGEDLFNKSTKVNNPYALVIGSEGQGVSKEILSLNNTKIAIPMDKRVESLNAGVSASIIMFELANRK